MLNQILHYLGVTLIIYILYTRVIRQYMKWWFYRKQGIKFPSWPIPILGDFLLVGMRQVKDGTRNHLLELIRERTGERCPPINGFTIGKDVALFINAPELLQEAYVTKNKYFDKHPGTKDKIKVLMNDSLVFQKSDELWAKKRKALSAAFYKDKLAQMTNIIKRVTLDHIEKWRKEESIDIFSSIANLNSDIILNCAFG